MTTPAASAASHPDQKLKQEVEERLGVTWNKDDSLSGEEHFLAPMQRGSPSWEEALSLDDISEDRRVESLCSSSRDRRRCFDSTTPTLVDEEEEVVEEGGEDEESELASSLGHISREGSEVLSPGAGIRLRRTPGATLMHQSSTGATDPSGLSPFKVALGVEDDNGPKWSYPSAEDDEEIASQKQHHLDNSGMHHPSRLNPAVAVRSESVYNRGSFSFAPWAKNNHTPFQPTPSEARAFSPNILRLTEDIGNLLHEDEDDDTYAIEIPSVFRGFGDQHGPQGGIMATENAALGADWTGSYVFDQQQTNNKFGIRKGGTVQRPSTTVKDGKTRRRSNHHYHNQVTVAQQQQYLHTGFFPISSIEQPQHKHNSHQMHGETFPQHRHVFEFGKQQQHRDGDGCSTPSPQLLNLGVGAFVPRPQQTKDSSPFQYSSRQQSNFEQPVASFPVVNAQYMHPLSQQHIQIPQHTDGPPIFGIPPPTLGPYQSRPQQTAGPQMFGIPPSVESYQSRQLLPTGVIHPVPHYFGPTQPSSDFNGAGDGPTIISPHRHHHLGVQYHGHQERLSEMHATAQEFIPMMTQSSTPSHQFRTPHQEQPLPPQWQSSVNFEPPSMVEPLNWSSGAVPGRYQFIPVASSSGFNLPPGRYSGSETLGVQGSSSPLSQAWQQLPPPPLDSTLYGLPASSTPIEAVAPPLLPVVVASPSSAPSSVNHAPPMSPMVLSQSNRDKKEPRRTTRGRKKKIRAPDKSSATPAVGTGNVVKKKGNNAFVASHEGGIPDDTGLSVPEETGDVKRGELEESPATRIAFKDFYRAFRGEEKHSFQKAEELAQQALQDGSLPESIHWRVYLELADLARRSNRYMEARRLYQKVCQLQPYASQGWLEYSKLEEDCGFMNRVSNILHAGLEYCEYSETLLTRAVKHQERLGNLVSARGILARLKHVGIDKVWRTVLEGALLESRAGNHEMSRRVLKYLMHHVPWYGPLYLEAYKLERDQGHPTDAMQIVERGLTALPRYGPLWFGAFRLYEEMDVTEGLYHLPRTMLMIERAKCTISKELVWKLHLEAAQMLERTALAYVEESGFDLELYLSPVRRRFILTILTCPQNLKWKVWLAAGRMELAVGKVEATHSLFQRAHDCVQQKSKSATLLDCARLAEFRGDVDLARAILCKARSFYGNDWKVWFESVLVEIRNDNHARGYEIAANGLDLHSGSGRLWATLVQLGQLVGGDEMQTNALERALSAVPKSGEVWCEGARIHLNPFSCTFDLHRAKRYLYFAAKFTPQFGDSFIESIRLEVLSQWLHPIAKYIWKKTKWCLSDDENGSVDKKIATYIMNVSHSIAVARMQDLEQYEDRETKFTEIIGTLRKKLKAEHLRSSIDLTDLRLSCSNADPNYGSLWFHCRKRPTYTLRRVIEHAAEDIADEVFKYANIYLAAMIRRMAVLATSNREMPQGAEGTLETCDQEIIHWESYIDKKLRGAISLRDILNSVDSRTGMALLESAIGGSIFITGLSELNTYKPLHSMTLLERRKALFGTDALFP